MEDKYERLRQYNLDSRVAKRHPELSKMDKIRKSLSQVLRSKKACEEAEFDFSALKKIDKPVETGKVVQIDEVDPLAEITESPVMSNETMESNTEALDTSEDELVDNELIITDNSSTSDEADEPENMIHMEESENENIDFGEYELSIEKTPNGLVIVSGIIPNDYEGDVEIPEGVTSIAEMAFLRSSFRSIKIPSTMRYLGDACFKLSKIKSIELPPSVDAIPHECFMDSKLEVFDFKYIKSIGNRAFRGTKLSSVKLIQNVERIGLESFADITNLTEFKHNHPVKHIRAKAFSGCTSLADVDLTGVESLEEGAFTDTAIEKIFIPKEIDYLKSGAITSANLREVIIEEGLTKIGCGSVGIVGYRRKRDTSEADKVKLTIEIPRSVSNIDSDFMQDYFKIRCYSKSVAESAAKLAGCEIEYIDADANLDGIMKVRKATVFEMDIHNIMAETIVEAYSKEDVIHDVKLPSNIINIEMNQQMMSMLGLDLQPAPIGYEESTKFKGILRHLAIKAPLAPQGLTNAVLACVETFSTSIEYIYKDDVSFVAYVTYQDNRYLSKTSRVILAVTGVNVRYICFPNRFTDIKCKTNTSTDLSKLMSWISPGDTIGCDCMIRGSKIEQAVGDSSILLKDIHEGSGKKHYGQNEKMKVNILQALMYTGIVIKLDGNRFVIYSPSDDVMLLCASQGKSVWANEADDNFKKSRAVIIDIKNLDEAYKFFETDSRVNDKNDGYIKYLAGLNENQITNRLADYSVVGEAVISKYLDIRNIVYSRQINSVEKLTSKSVMIMMKLPRIEERSKVWFSNALKKTITKANLHKINLADGGVIYQYQTVHRVAMRNKLLIAGNRTMYVYDIRNKYDNQLGIFIGDKPIEKELSSFVLGIDYSSAKASRVYSDPSKFDVVSENDIVELMELYNNRINNKIGAGTIAATPIWLVMYRPNGYYYISYKKGREHALLIQLGDLDASFDYISGANSYNIPGAKELLLAGRHTFGVRNDSATRLSFDTNFSDRRNSHSIMLEARKLAISGETRVKAYRDLGLPPVLCHLIGIGSAKDNLYELPELDSEYPEELKLSNEVYNSINIVEEPSKVENLMDYSEVDGEYIDFDEGEAIDFGDTNEIIEEPEDELEIPEGELEIAPITDAEISGINENSDFGYLQISDSDDDYYQDLGDEEIFEESFEEEDSSEELEDTEDLELLRKLQGISNPETPGNIVFDDIDSIDDLM